MLLDMIILNPGQTPTFPSISLREAPCWRTSGSVLRKLMWGQNTSSMLSPSAKKPQLRLCPLEAKYFWVSPARRKARHPWPSAIWLRAQVRSQTFSAHLGDPLVEGHYELYVAGFPCMELVFCLGLGLLQGLVRGSQRQEYTPSQEVGSSSLLPQPWLCSYSTGSGRKVLLWCPH